MMRLRRIDERTRARRCDPSRVTCETSRKKTTKDAVVRIGRRGERFPLVVRIADARLSREPLCDAHELERFDFLRLAVLEHLEVRLEVSPSTIWPSQRGIGVHHHEVRAAAEHGAGRLLGAGCGVLGALGSQHNRDHYNRGSRSGGPGCGPPQS